MKVLLVQSRNNPGGIQLEQENFKRGLQGTAELDFLSALDEKLAWMYPNEFLKGYDGVMLGGSADFDLHGGRTEEDPARLTAMIILSRVRSIILFAMAERIPLLGICFGHQLVAQLHEGHVECDTAQKKQGAHEVHLTEEGKRDAFFGHLPESFRVQYWHKDSVTNHPKGATLLATGANCRFSALRYGDRAYTMQFHPESSRPIPGAAPSHPASRVLPLWIEHIVGAN